MGELDVLVKANNKRVASKLIDKGDHLYRVYFMPKEAIRHLLYVTYCKEAIPGSYLI